LHYQNQKTNPEQCDSHSSCQGNDVIDGDLGEVLARVAGPH